MSQRINVADPFKYGTFVIWCFTGKNGATGSKLHIPEPEPDGGFLMTACGAHIPQDLFSSIIRVARNGLLLTTTGMVKSGDKTFEESHVCKKCVLVRRSHGC